jgi:putative colanic acid biosysnthesis UDP-glucose lipid carrier transferase
VNSFATSVSSATVFSHREHKGLVKLTDAVLIVIGLWAINRFYDKTWADLVMAGLIAVPVYLLVGDFCRLYRTWRSEPLWRENLVLGAVWVITVALLLLMAYLSKTSADYSRLVLTTWFVAMPVLLMSWRVGLRSVLTGMRSRGYDIRKVAVAGSGKGSARVVDIIRQSPWMGLKLIGVFDDQPPTDTIPPVAGPSLAGEIKDLLALVRDREVDVIYMDLPLGAADSAHARALIDELADTTVSVYLVPDSFLIEPFRGRWVNLDWLPIISLFETPFYGLTGRFKRIEDLVLASLILTVAAVPMLLIATAIRVTSGGPVLFKQKRYGLDGKEIDVWKFRTMTVCENGDRIMQARRDDDRNTPLGSFLRKTSLDELPQFFNVLQGSMSVVGPRPHAVAHNEHYRTRIKGYMMRHKVKPGITGWAQVNGWRGQTDTLEKMEHRVEHDLWYINNWSPMLDLKIVLLTALKGLTGRNVY